MENNEKNYAIEFFRFLFITIIAIHHLQPRFNIQYIASGYLGVEFFFILSGFFLANKFERKRMKSGIEYTKSRLKKLYPSYLLALSVIFILTVTSAIIEKNISITESIFRLFSEIFLMQNTGIFLSGLNAPLWYFSVLIIAGYFIYEFLIRDKEKFIKILAPITILLVYTVLSNYGTVENWQKNFCFYMPLLRGTADMLIGVLLFYLYIKYKNRIKETINKYKIICSLGEIVTYLLIVYLIIFKTSYEIYSILLFSILILLANTENSVTYKFFNKKMFEKLGNLSYPIYLNHAAIIMLMNVVFNHIIKLDNKLIIVIIFLMALIIYSIVTKYIINRIQNRKINIIKKKY